MAGREFEAKKEYVVMQSMSTMPEIAQIQSSGKDGMKFVNLRVPRRPVWDKHTTAEELNQKEKASFLEWRRQIAVLEEGDSAQTATPFEKNLEVWRQLWRVVERSDLLVQIVDARNPLFYRSGDLEKYVKEVGEEKQCLLVINKADFLTLKQRLAWTEYFTNLGIDFLFFSAKTSQDVLEASHDSEGANMFEFANRSKDKSAVLDRAQLLTYFRQMHLSRTSTDVEATTELAGRPTMVGMVGFPNVGKSSIINVILGALASTHGKGTRAAVGATPGKTKHFQVTLFVFRTCPLHSSNANADIVHIG